jgi:hypothetical protein
MKLLHGFGNFMHTLAPDSLCIVYVVILVHLEMSAFKYEYSCYSAYDGSINCCSVNSISILLLMAKSEMI